MCCWPLTDKGQCLQGGLDNAAVHALLESLSQANGGSAHLRGASKDLAAQLAHLQAADGANQQKQQVRAGHRMHLSC